MYNFSKEDIYLIRGCLLTTKETFKCIPIKTKEIKNKIIEIDDILEKINNL